MTAVLDRPVAVPPKGPGTARRPSVGPRRPLPRAVYRFRVAAVCLGLVALAFLQDPGRIAADTKLDLTQNPWGFMSRALHLWDTDGFFGQLQNQAYGYLWPMGPFFGVGSSVGLPGWAVQRLWWSLILVLAFLGVVRLSRLLGLGSPLGRVAAGLAYALSVRMLTTIGPISAESWPMALAPWVLVPLVVGSQRGSPRRWAAASGVVVLCLGSVNAVATLAVLPMGLWWIVTRTGGPRRRALFLWWALSVALACLWWLLPLLTLGRYSPPFLDWIESSATTTSPTDPTAVLRGASHWVAYVFDRGGAVWPAGWEFVTSGVVVLATAAVAALGLAGLSRRGLPERRFLLLCLLTGWTLVSFGHVDVVDGLGAEAVRSLLDGALAPLRNVHKFDPLLRLPLAIGLGWAVAWLWENRRVSGRRLRTAAWAGLALTALLIPLAAAPALSGALTRDRSYQEVPGYWREAAYWLDNVGQEGGRALITPGASFGIYLWGRTQDEPLQPIATSPWGVRDAVPLSSAGNIRLLDEVESRLASGKGSQGLASALTRAGVRYLVVRNDLDPARTGAPRQVLVHQALARSPGVWRVAFFGGVLGTFRTQDLVFDDGLQQAYPPVEIFEVRAPWEAPDPRIVLRDADRLVRFTGGPEALVTMADAGVLRDQPAVLAGDATPDDVIATDVVTDTNRRLEVNFGQNRDNRSATMSADQPFVLDRRVHDYDVQPGGGTKATASLVGAADVTASSSGADVDAIRGRSPSAQPFSALDGDPDTAWLSGDFSPGVGQWWEVRLDRPTRVDRISVRFLAGGQVGAAPSRVAVETDAGSLAQPVRGTGDPETLLVPNDGPVTRIRLTLEAVDGGGVGSGFGLREVAVPGVTVTRPVDLPGSVTGPEYVVLAGRPGARQGCVEIQSRLACSTVLPAAGEERAAVDRLVTIAQDGTYDVVVGVRPRPGTAVDRLLDGLRGTATATADSRLTSDAAVRPRAAVDDDMATAWVASPLNERPTLTVTLPERRTVRGVRVRVADDLAASRPLEVTVDAGAGPRRLFAGIDGLIPFPPVRTERISLTFGVTSEVRSLDPLTGLSRRLPVGVSEVEILGARDLVRGIPAGYATGVPCGFGPVVTVDGRDTGRTEVTTTNGTLLTGRTASARSCGGATGAVTLTAGTHRIRVASTDEFLVESVTLARTGADARWRAPESPAVLSWGATSRRISVAESGRPRTLELSENFNAGWLATLDGEALQPVRLDGWRQGWIVPAGRSGDVELTFGPDDRYRTGLLVGLVAALLLLALLCLPSRRPPSAPLRPRPGRVLPLAALLVSVTLVTGIAGLAVAAATALLVVAVTRRRPAAAAVTAGLTMLGAGVTAALVTWPSSASQPALLSAVQALLATVAVAATCATAVAAVPRADASSRTLPPLLQGR